MKPTMQATATAVTATATDMMTVTGSCLLASWAASVFFLSVGAADDSEGEVDSGLGVLPSDDGSYVKFVVSVAGNESLDVDVYNGLK